MTKAHISFSPVNFTNIDLQKCKLIFIITANVYITSTCVVTKYFVQYYTMHDKKICQANERITNTEKLLILLKIMLTAKFTFTKIYLRKIAMQESHDM